MSPKKSKKPKQTTTNIEDSKNCFTCDVCNALFTQKHHIIKHCRIHTGEKPYKCKVCRKSFRDQSKLLNHLNIHTRQKRFKCLCCNKEFKKTDDLLVHYRKHSYEKPFKCNQCNVSFTSNGYLTRHTRTKQHLKIQEQNIPKKVNYSYKINECYVLLQDFNKQKIIHKSSKTSTSNNIKNNSENINNNSLLLKTQAQNIKKIKKEDSEVINVNNLENGHISVRTEETLYNQINECFVLLSDCNKHKTIYKSNKASTINTIKISPEDEKDNSSILIIQGKNNKKDSKVQNINNLKNNDSQKRHTSQLKECFVLLSDFNKKQKYS